MGAQAIPSLASLKSPCAVPVYLWEWILICSPHRSVSVFGAGSWHQEGGVERLGDGEELRECSLWTRHGLVHSRACRDRGYLHKIWKVKDQAWASVGRGSGGPVHSYWQLVAVGRGRWPLLWGLDLWWVSVLQRVIPHLYTYGQY